MKKDFNSPEEKKIMKSMISDHNKQHKGTSNEIKSKVVKKMSKGEAFKDWAKRANYDPKHKRDSNSPAGVYQGKGSHFAIAGKHYEEKKGSHWK